MGDVKGKMETAKEVIIFVGAVVFLISFYGLIYGGGLWLATKVVKHAWLN